MYIDIRNRLQIESVLSSLKSDTQPVFGIMSAQQMIEHLILVLQASNGKKDIPLSYPEERTEKSKNIFIYSERALPIGYKAPFLPAEGTVPTECSTLASAIEKLFEELNDFDTYFAQLQDEKRTHPVMGNLNYNEWVIFHNKHFTHHFKQFSLI